MHQTGQISLGTGPTDFGNSSAPLAYQAQTGFYRSQDQEATSDQKQEQDLSKPVFSILVGQRGMRVMIVQTVTFLSQNSLIMHFLDLGVTRMVSMLLE
jgi:hypothetical protein